MDNVEYASLLAENRKLKTEIARIEAQKNRKYELIEEITVNEDDVSVVNRTREANGLAYDFEKVYIEITAQTASSASKLYISANGICVFYSSGILATSGSRFAVSKMEIKNGILQNESTGSTTVETTGTNGVAKYEVINLIDNLQTDSITSIEIYTPITIPIGSTIKIYAIRRDT